MPLQAGSVRLNTFDIHKILTYLPHRYPFLLLDRVLDCVPGEAITAIKNVSINEPYFGGHFPQRPIMPGVLILEALAQATGILAFETVGYVPGQDMLYYFVGIDNARFKKPVEPGDQLLLEARITRSRRQVWQFATQASVADVVVAEADLMCAARKIADD